MRYKGRSSLEFFFSFQRNIWGVSRAGDIVVLASDIQAWAGGRPPVRPAIGWKLEIGMRNGICCWLDFCFLFCTV